MSKPWTVGFVGSGEATRDNVRHVLDEWMHGNRDYNPPLIPHNDEPGHKGLIEVGRWLGTEFGEDNIDLVTPIELLEQLVAARKSGKSEVYLVYVPGEDDPFAGLVANAVAEGIDVLDLTAGLYPYAQSETKVLDDLGPQGETLTSTVEKPSRTRGRARENGPSKEELDASMADPNPPWNEDDPEKGKATPSSTNNTEAVEQMLDDEAALRRPKVSVELSQETIDLFLAALASFAADITTAAVPAPKPKTRPFWLNGAEGSYRPRGLGRPRKGETAVDLTDAEVEDLENRGLL